MIVIFTVIIWCHYLLGTRDIGQGNSHDDIKRHREAADKEQHGKDTTGPQIVVQELTSTEGDADNNHAGQAGDTSNLADQTSICRSKIILLFTLGHNPLF